MDTASSACTASPPTVRCFSRGERRAQGRVSSPCPTACEWTAADRILVLDRENRRLQIFDADGNYQGEWTDLDGPNDLYIDKDDNVYIAEGNYRISVFNLDGKLLARWGEHGEAAGQFADHPHGLWLDSRGDLYVAEVPFLDNRLQKFTPRMKREIHHAHHPTGSTL